MVEVDKREGSSLHLGEHGSSFISIEESDLLGVKLSLGAVALLPASAIGDEARGWGTSVMEAESLVVVFSNHPLTEVGSVVKAEASSHAFKRASAFSIASLVRGAKKDLIPSNFSRDEMAKSLPVVALDEEGSHPLPLRCSGSEAALLAVEEAEINGSSSSLKLVWPSSET